MVSFFRISILFFAAIFIQSSLQNKIDNYINKEAPTSSLVERGLKKSGNIVEVSINNDDVSNNDKKRVIVGGGHGQKCHTIMKVKTKRVQFHGCLLYTSPSPRDATLSRMPSSA